jgi:hypothetical protein
MAAGLDAGTYTFRVTYAPGPAPALPLPGTSAVRSVSYTASVDVR